MVTDTGAGVPKERLGAIFEPFSQGAAADAAVQGGVGLGLAIVRELVVLMDGEVRVESEAGKGSRFAAELRLPAEDGATVTVSVDLLRPRADSRGAVLRRAHGGLRVLVCEDNLVNQKVLLAMLERLGHDALVADDGASAWEVLERGSVDLVLTDLEMPGLGGLELARRVRAREAERGGPRVPIVGATAHVGKEGELLDAGMDAHLGKPFTLDQLTEVLEGVRRPSDAGKRATGSSARRVASDPAPPDAAEVLDAGIIEELRRLQAASGTTLLADLLASFRGDVPARVEELRAAAGVERRRARQQPRPPSLARSAPAVIGASRVAARATEIESNARTAPAETTMARVEELAREVGRALDAFARAVSSGEGGAPPS